MKTILVLIAAVLLFSGCHDLTVHSPYFSVGLINEPIIWPNFIWAVGSIVIALLVGLLAKSLREL